ncbi:MAG: hypothetical protein ACPGQS_14700 [Bradymonadia bacterium]
MNHSNTIPHSITARAHQFAIDAMIQTSLEGILAHLMKTVAKTSVDAIALSIRSAVHDRYLLSSRGAVSAEAKERIRLTLDALSRDDDDELLIPIIQTPCLLSLSEVDRIERTYEGWYRRFPVGEDEITLIAFHGQQTIVDTETRQLLIALCEVLEATLVMMNHKKSARIKGTTDPHTLITVNLDGIDEVRAEFGDFEANELIDGLIESIRHKTDGIGRIGQDNLNQLSIILPEADKTLLNELKLHIAETIRFFPAPAGHHLDAQLRVHTMTPQAAHPSMTTYSVHTPTPPRTNQSLVSAHG